MTLPKSLVAPGLSGRPVNWISSPGTFDHHPRCANPFSKLIADDLPMGTM